MLAAPTRSRYGTLVVQGAGRVFAVPLTRMRMPHGSRFQAPITKTRSLAERRQVGGSKTPLGDRVEQPWQDFEDHRPAAAVAGRGAVVQQ